VSNSRKLKQQRQYRELRAFSAVAAEELELLGVEFVVDIALAAVHEAVLGKNYRLTAEQAGTLLALAQTVKP